MKKLIILALVVLSLTAFAQTSNRVLVAYFSFTDNTKGIAEKLANVANADLYRIVPSVAYGSENSNYYDESTRAYQEQYGPASARPAIEQTLTRTDYDVVLLGFPIWYGKVPRVVLTFLDTYSFAGKTIIPFCTSVSSGISAAENELHSTYTNITWLTGARLNGKSESELKTWWESFGLTTALDEVNAGLSDGHAYTLSGQQAPGNFKGIVIQNGHKIIK